MSRLSGRASRFVAMTVQPQRRWTAESLLDLSRAYQPAAVLAAAAELELFEALLPRPLAAQEVARRRDCDLRGMTILLDALAALQLVTKRDGRYGLRPDVAELLIPDSPRSVLAMAQHQANCLRRWAQLARVVRSGRPVRRAPGVRGVAGDAEAFIAAMHNISAPVADRVIRAVRPLRFQHLLDVGGASGTWTIAFLRACPEARATLLDLPHVIPMARRRLAAEGLIPRVRLVAGDFNRQPLPGGADLAWVSAIVHQNSRAENRALFARLFKALKPGGRVAIRDILMETSRTAPLAGALFAVNMLVATTGGGTFTFAELRQDLEAAGFRQVRLCRRDAGMNSVLVARKPASPERPVATGL